MNLRRKEILLVAAVTVLGILCTTLAIAWLSRVLEHRSQTDLHCTSKECVVTAATFVESMDESVDPCRDFYSFVCNGYLKTSSPLDDHFRRRNTTINEQVKELLENKTDGSRSIAVKKIRAAYDACLNTDRIEARGIENIKKFVDDVLGGWPLAMGSSWTPSTDFPLENLLAKLKRFGLPNNLFTMVVNVNPRYPTKNQIQLDEAAASSSEFDLRGKRRRRRKREAEDNENILRIILKLAKFLGSSNDTARVKSEAETMLRLESELEGITASTEGKWNLSNVYNNVAVNELQTITKDKFNWLRYFKTTFEGFAQIGEQEEIIVTDFQYFEELFRTLRKYDQKVVVNLAVWKSIKELAELIQTPTESWYKCVQQVSQIFPFALWRLYAEKYVTDQTLRSTQELVDNLREAYSESIRRSEWVDSTTKDKAVVKLNSIVFAIGYPSWVLDDLALDAYYETILITQDHFVNAMNGMQFAAEKTLKNLIRSVDRNEWPDELNALNTNAFNVITMNKIYIPAAMLYRPFYAADRLESLNYGSIGMMIGHEIGHAFDIEGSQLDERGALREWWNENDHEEYAERSRCFEDQYNGYCFVEDKSDDADNTCVDGNRTLGENVSDNAGLLCAFKAYKSWVKKHGVEKQLPSLEKYTAEQMFFIGFGYTWCENVNAEQWAEYFSEDPHSPGRFRVIGPLSNMKDFSTAFNCPVNRTIFRNKNKCTLW